MNIHDWTRVGDSTFPDFHTTWIVYLKSALRKLLPEGYYVHAEQHIGRKIADILTLHTSDPEPVISLPTPLGEHTAAVAEVPPRVSYIREVTPSAAHRRRTLTIRHTNGHRIVALIEIVSPANKATENAVSEFTGKIASALRTGIHAAVIDLFPPGSHDPRGMHEAILEVFGDEDDELPSDKPLTLASYIARSRPTAYLNHVTVGDPVPDLPLFLTPDHYITLPLATTYPIAFRGVGQFWCEVLEGKRSPPE